MNNSNKHKTQEDLKLNQYLAEKPRFIFNFTALTAKLLIINSKPDVFLPANI